MEPHQILINSLTKTIDNAINGFNGAIPDIQRQMLADVTDLVKQLEVFDDGTIKTTVNNLRIIGKINNKLQNTILNDDYLKNVKEFADAFQVVAKINATYFSAIESKFKTTPLLKEIQSQSIDAAIEGLTENGIGANITDGIKDILNRNITTGGKFSDLVDQLREHIMNTDSGDGALQKYTKTYTTDALNQYSANYLQIVSSDLDMNWHMYLGSNIKTTRSFCLHLTAKIYVHSSELPEILNGNIDGFQCKINSNTNLWYGAIDGTNEANFPINRGGYNCGHQYIPVLDGVVPQELRDRFANP